MEHDTAAGSGGSILDVQWRDHRRLEELMDAYEAPEATAEQRGAAAPPSCRTNPISLARCSP